MQRMAFRNSKEFRFTILAILALGVSVNFFILCTAGVAPFAEYRNYLLIPSVFIILFIAIYGYKKNRRLANRLVAGLWIGLVATLALEAVRIPSIYLQWIPHDDMIALPGMLLVNPPSIKDFNAMIGGHNEGMAMNDSSGNSQKSSTATTQTQTQTMSDKAQNNVKHDSMNDNMPMTDSSKNSELNVKEQKKSVSSTMGSENTSHSPQNTTSHNSKMMNDVMQVSPLELVVGTFYHFWNGATMAAVYTIVIGKGKWYYGLVWGFIIHLGMMLAPWMLPMVGPFGINYGSGYSIFTASLLAHLAYGAVIGILAQRFIKDKRSLITLIRSEETQVVQ